MSTSSDFTISHPNVSIPKLNPVLKQSVSTEEDISFQKSKEALNNSILWAVKQLESSKTSYIINSTNKIKAEHEFLTNLIQETNIKIKKFKSLLDYSNACNNPFAIPLLWEQYKNEICNSTINQLTEPVGNTIIANSFMNYATNKSLSSEYIEKLENNTYKMLSLKNDLMKFYEILKIKLNWDTYKRIKKLEQRIERKWKLAESSYQEIAQPKLSILIQLDNYANSLYQKYIETFDQIAKKYQKFHKTIEGNKRNKDYDNIIYLGYSDGITVFDMGSEKQIYHYWDRKDRDLNCSNWIIKLPNNELFCCGAYYLRGWRNPFYRKIITTWILDSKTFKLKKRVPCLLDIDTCSGLFYNNFVYLFGYRLSLSFDMQLGIWKRFSMIDLSFKVSCILFNRAILLCGDKPGVFKYDIAIDSYSEIGLEINGGLKLLAFSSERAYIIEFDGFIYESEKGNEYCWNAVCEGIISQSENQIYWVADSYCIMFGTYSEDKSDDDKNFHYYLFDFKNKSLSQAKGFSIKDKDNASTNGEELCKRII